jgi:hypothetical protein
LFDDRYIRYRVPLFGHIQRYRQYAAIARLENLVGH